jgi:hypothetical protein
MGIKKVHQRTFVRNYGCQTSFADVKVDFFMGDAPQVFEIEKTETTTHPNLKVGKTGC